MVAEVDIFRIMKEVLTPPLHLNLETYCKAHVGPTTVITKPKLLSHLYGSLLEQEGIEDSGVCICMMVILH